MNVDMWDPIVAVGVWVIGCACAWVLMAWGLRLVLHGIDRNMMLNLNEQEGYDPATRREP